VDEGALDGVLVDVGKDVWRADEDGASADDGHCEEDDQLQPVNDRRCVAPVVQNLQHTIDTQHKSKISTPDSSVKTIKQTNSNICALSMHVFAAADSSCYFQTMQIVVKTSKYLYRPII
jgi:hypothetical protein